MTSIKPRDAYSPEEINRLYPKSVELQLVQILMRHGERTPVSARFQNTGLPVYWPYCSVARSMASATMNKEDTSDWGAIQWRRRIEGFGSDDGPVIAAGPNGEIDAVCGFGELTDQGRLSTHALGSRFRRLYVEQLGFMPENIKDADMIYLRATAVPRALESMQEAFWGMYPAQHRASPFPPPTIVTRALADENLFPNDGNCRRFASLSRAFAKRTAVRWNETEEMDYLNHLLGKWMPETSKRIAVDGHPRLSGIMDTVNSTLAHSKDTRLPKEFYDARAREIIDKIGVEEWFSGFKESREYRTLGVGSLMGDIVARMVGSVEKNGNDGITEIGGSNHAQGLGRGGETAIKLAINGCHDTTLAGLLASLGTFENSKWPPYTSHIAIELFRKSNIQADAPSAGTLEENSSRLTTAPRSYAQGWFASIFGGKSLPAVEGQAPGIARRHLGDLSTSERSKIDGYFVRVRYNDEVMTIPGCKKAGNHLEDDETFCTLAAFKHIVDKFTPKNWKSECRSNLDAARMPEIIEPAGY